MPPGRHWAAGAIVREYAGAQSQLHAAAPGTIYLAPMPGGATRVPGGGSDPAGYSIRSATVGFTRAARRAGR
jgi:hypothetical protein